MKKLRYLIVCFTQCSVSWFFFDTFGFLLPAFCLSCVICGVHVCMCRDTSRSGLSHRLACLCLHVLRAYCNFESKQVISISLDYSIWATPK